MKLNTLAVEVFHLRTIMRCGVMAIATGVAIAALADDSAISLVGDFGRRVLPAGASAKVTDLLVEDANGIRLSPKDYSVVYENNAVSGTATVRVTVDAGALAGASATRSFEIVVLPEGFVPVEWIRSTGAQWINTGVVPTKAGTGIDMRFGRVKKITNTSSYSILGQAAVWKNFWLAINKSGFLFEYNKSIPGYGENRDYHLIIEPYDADLGGGRVTMDYGEGPVTSTGYTNDTGNQGQRGLTLFGAKDAGSTSYRLYAFKMTASGETVRDFVPVRRIADGKPGLFDCANPDAGDKALFFNGGSGVDFKCGPGLADFRPVSAIPAQVYNGVDVCHPVVGLVDRRTGRALDTAGFTFAYAGGDAVGTGSLTITGKSGTDYAGQIVILNYPVLQPYRVTSDAAGDGSGLSWNSPMTLDEALAVVATNEKGGAIWLKSGKYQIEAVKTLTPVKSVVISGGFAGDETRAADRPADALSTFDAGSVASGCLKVVNADGADVTVERIDFENGLNGSMFAKTGAGDVTLVDCVFCGARDTSTTTSYSGLGASLTGTFETHAVISNCVFRENNAVCGKRTGTGLGLYLSTFLSAEVINCSFIRNGEQIGGGYKDYYVNNTTVAFGAAALCVNAAPARVKGCRFTGNLAATRSKDQTHGSILAVEGESGGTVLENCLVYGNSTYSTEASVANTGGNIRLNLAAETDAVEVRNCTVAYNYNDDNWCASGISLIKGKLKIVDSILYDNVRNTSASASTGADLWVQAAGRCDVSYSIITADTNKNGSATSIATADPDRLTIDRETVKFVDPLFMTGHETAMSYIHIGSKRNTKCFLPDEIETVMAFNLHLRGKKGYYDESTHELVKSTGKSPAIDAGAPASDYSREPSPNGGRVNMGFYGNTPWATMSGGGLMILLR